MNVCVLGLWHLGSVTAACLAAAGHQVVGLDFDTTTVQGLQSGRPPLHEPGLDALVEQGIASGRLSFTTNAREALARATLVWVTFDTPVDDDDHADVGFVEDHVTRIFSYLAEGTLVLVSSQVPVGTVHRLEREYARTNPDKQVTWGYSPENLRLGKAIEVFRHPERVVVGLRDEADRGRVAELLGPSGSRIEWMSVESAEMTKHALNAFFAMSIAFANEIANLCEKVGADAKEVERGLKTEARIGPKAYLSPGAAFAGGTLARDIRFLTDIGMVYEQPMYLMSSIYRSNDAHKLWIRHKLQELLGELAGQRVAVWGLTYKPGTDTLRRSTSVELCRWLASQGVDVRAHDPAVKGLPKELQPLFRLSPTALASLEGAAALVVATEWPEYRGVPAETIVATMRRPVVVDPNRFLTSISCDPEIRYAAVGKAIP